jgi:PIN domain nuclease of toxin-antitoxin system
VRSRWTSPPPTPSARETLDWDHPDPFDRMLAAQSLLHHAALLTRDAAFGELRGLTVLW